jgi:hypothetical protein
MPPSARAANPEHAQAGGVRASRPL